MQSCVDLHFLSLLFISLPHSCSLFFAVRLLSLPLLLKSHTHTRILFPTVCARTSRPLPISRGRVTEEEEYYDVRARAHTHTHLCMFAYVNSGARAPGRASHSIHAHTLSHICLHMHPRTQAHTTLYPTVVPPLFRMCILSAPLLLAVVCSVAQSSPPPLFFSMRTLIPAFFSSVELSSQP